jgi:hypothetical protein
MGTIRQATAAPELPEVEEAGDAAETSAGHTD